ncbi:MAG: glycosyltransferase family 39 protein [Patescibacteria group bacterium]|jgi:hypothetical protein
MKLKKVFLHLGLLGIFVIISLTISINKSIWRDEAFSILISRKSPFEIIQSSAADVSPPLFYFLLNFWQKIGGTKTLVLRGLPLLFSLATLTLLYAIKPFIFRVIEKVSKSKIGKIEDFTYLAVITLNAGLIYFSAELRSYSLLMFLVLGSLSLLYLNWLNTRKLWWVLLTLVNIAILYTHNLGLIWLGSQAIAVIALGILLRSFKNLPKMMLSLGISLLAFSPWFSILFSQVSLFKGSGWIEFGKVRSLEEYWGMYAVNEGVIKNILLYEWFFRISRLLTFLGGLAIVERYKKLKLGLLTFVGVAVGIYFASMYVTPILYSRYLSFLIPLTVLGAFLGLMTLKQFSIKGFYIILATYLILNSLIIKEYILRPSKTNYAFIKELAQGPIYTDEVLDVTPCVYYSSQCYFVGEISETPRHIGPAQLVTLPHISSWEKVKHDNIFVLGRDGLSEKGQEALLKLAYKKVESVSLGDGVVLAKYQK